MKLFGYSTIVFVCLTFGYLAPVSNADESVDGRIESLIDQLVEIDSPDTGYAQFFSGTNFLPYEGTGQMGTFIVGATARSGSPVMRTIVEAGYDAVPILIKHLDDKRKVKLPPIELGGMMWIAFDNEYDFNSAALKRVPTDVNLDSLGDDREQPSRHEITVGDLCFVALGQIVNRSWSAIRYQPTGGQIINSPTYSAELRKAIIDEWGSLDRDTHRKKLIEDFVKPDSEDRISGAYLRLSLYYPEAVEKLVLEFLNRPIADGKKSSLFLAQLVHMKDAAARKQKLEAILDQHGHHYRDAIQDELFTEIIATDTREKNGIKLDPNELRTRQILHETFGWKQPVKYEDWRKRAKTTFSNYETARIIKAFVHDQSQTIGNRVQAIMDSERFKDDSYMVEACLTSLASRRQSGEFLAERMRSLDFCNASRGAIPPSYLAAISKSKTMAVQLELKKIALTSKDPNFFLIAAGAVTDDDAWAPLLFRAKEILHDLPVDTKNGRQLLELILEKSPDEVEAVFSDFLKPNTPTRCNTVCEALWYNQPVSQRVLLPLLDDERPIPGLTGTVRDRAAQAISHSIESIKFDYDWSKSERNSATKKSKNTVSKKSERGIRWVRYFSRNKPFVQDPLTGDPLKAIHWHSSGYRKFQDSISK